MHRFYVTGFSNRFGMWIAETYECKSRAKARERFVAKYPTLKGIKAYALRAETP
jgi:hypothetical protein